MPDTRSTDAVVDFTHQQLLRNTVMAIKSGQISSRKAFAILCIHIQFKQPTVGCEIPDGLMVAIDGEQMERRIAIHIAIIEART